MEPHVLVNNNNAKQTQSGITQDKKKTPPHLRTRQRTSSRPRLQTRLGNHHAMTLPNMPHQVIIDGVFQTAPLPGTLPSRPTRVCPKVFLQVTVLVEAFGAELELALVGTGVSFGVFSIFSGVVMVSGLDWAGLDLNGKVLINRREMGMMEWYGMGMGSLSIPQITRSTKHFVTPIIRTDQPLNWLMGGLAAWGVGPTRRCERRLPAPRSCHTRCM